MSDAAHVLAAAGRKAGIAVEPAELLRDGSHALFTLPGRIVARLATVEAFGQAYAPTFSQVLIFVLMAVVVLARPAGLFGREEATA